MTLARIGVVIFTLVRVGSLGRIKGSTGLVVFAWVYFAASRGRRVYQGSRGFTVERNEVVGLINDRVGSLWRSLGSSGSFKFSWVRSGAQRDSFDTPSGRSVHLGFTQASLGVFGFIRVRLGPLGFVYASSSSRLFTLRVHLGSHGFTRAVIKVAGFIRVPMGSLGSALGTSG